MARWYPFQPKGGYQKHPTVQPEHRLGSARTPRASMARPPLHLSLAPASQGLAGCRRARVSPRGAQARGVRHAAARLGPLRAAAGAECLAHLPNLLTLWKGRLFRDRAAVVANILSRDVVKAYAIPLASKIVYFYYPRRLKDLLSRYGPVLWPLCRHNQHVRALADRKSQLAEWLALGWQKPR
jgi:hypothetical protein